MSDGKRDGDGALPPETEAVPEPTEEVAVPEAPKGRGRLNSNQRVRKSTAHGTTIHPTTKPTKAKKPKAAKKSEKVVKEKVAKSKLDGLRLHQLRTLKALGDMGGTNPTAGMTIIELGKKAKISPAMIRFAVGPTDPTLWDAHDLKYKYLCLLTLGMVKAFEDLDRQVTTFYLTALGQRELKKGFDGGLFKFGKPNTNQHAGK